MVAWLKPYDFTESKRNIRRRQWRQLIGACSRCSRTVVDYMASESNCLHQTFTGWFTWDNATIWNSYWVSSCGDSFEVFESDICILNDTLGAIWIILREAYASLSSQMIWMNGQAYGPIDALPSQCNSKCVRFSHRRPTFDFVRWESYTIHKIWYLKTSKCNTLIWWNSLLHQMVDNCLMQE